MNFRSIRMVAFLAGYFAKTYPTRKRLFKMAETNPQGSHKLAMDDIKQALTRMNKIAGTTIYVEGLENIPQEACLYVANHASLFDVVVTAEVIPEGCGYVGKISLEKIPGLSSWMRLIHCLFLDREDIRAGVEMIKTGVSYIKEGYSMFIFPEGTRTKTGEIAEFKGGSLKMAQRADAPIVPIALSGTADILEHNKNLSIKPATVKITFGKPFRFTDLSKEEKRQAAEYTRALVAKMVEEQKDPNWAGTLYRL